MSLRDTINALCLSRLGRVPDLENPKGYNDCIQWLKLFDQREEHITCCDKIAVRQWVAERARINVLIPASNRFPPTEYPCIAKATHDSGGTVALESEADVPKAREKLAKRLALTYGVDKGEWAYQFVPPAVIVERRLARDMIDFKFHCSHDQIRWVQIIWDRGLGTKEAIFLPDGQGTDLHMDHHMQHCPHQSAYPGDEAWRELSELALILCRGWRYVRVDLYWHEGQAWFGELTFWPLSGAYKTADEPRFGQMLEMDLSYRMEPIVS